MTDRLERLTNLVATLLDTRRPLTLEEIVDLVPGYPDDKLSYRRQFERDKDTLRGIGIPVRLESVDELGPEQGYRIPPDEYYLPSLDLTADEQAALHVAVTAVRLEGGPAPAEALWKLGGREGEAAHALAALPTVPALPALFDAYRTRSTVTFTYRGEGRHIDPWGILFRRGHWYVVGHDHDRGEQRSFRVDRIEGDVDAGPARRVRTAREARAGRGPPGRAVAIRRGGRRGRARAGGRLAGGGGRRPGRRVRRHGAPR